jgi:mycothiol synthase
VTVQLPQAPAISGLTFRHYRGAEDHPAMRRVNAAASAAVGREHEPTQEEFDLSYSTLVNCDPHRDIVMAEVHGELVAYARVFWTDQVDGSRNYENFGFVDPEWRRRGIGWALHQRNEARLREIAGGHPGVAEQWLSSSGPDRDLGNEALMARSGYEPIRHFYDMVAPSLDGIDQLPLPDGLEVRPAAREHLRHIWDASVEAFRDHWGEPEMSEADWRRFEGNPDYAERPFWMIAWDGDEIAGLVITTVPREDNEAHGRARVFVDTVATRRPWRRRGLARALMARSLVAAREAGYTSALLDVDAENVTGALGLYESLGFEAVRRETAYRKPLRRL